LRTIREGHIFFEPGLGTSMKQPLRRTLLLFVYYSAIQKFVTHKVELLQINDAWKKVVNKEAEYRYMIEVATI
jgi:D-arabinose 1-dehydrogenase-like Zn-dependent alcohol dehydrogenase